MAKLGLTPNRAAASRRVWSASICLSTRSLRSEEYAFPDGCTYALVENCPALTSVSFPEGCTDAQVRDCRALASVTFPEGCTDAWVENCPSLESVNGKPVNTADQAMPYLEAIAAVALEPGKLNMRIVKREAEKCGTVACIAAGLAFCSPML